MALRSDGKSLLLLHGAIGEEEEGNWRGNHGGKGGDFLFFPNELKVIYHDLHAPV